MSRTPSLLALAVAALLAPAAASAATFTGTTSDGHPITFEATGQQVRGVNTAYPLLCTGTAGLELFQPTGSLLANGAETKVSELLHSAVLGRDVTQNIAFTATIDGTRARGAIDVNFATVDYDLLSSTMRTTVCSGRTEFTASAPEAAPPQQGDRQPAADQPKRKGARKTTTKKGRKGRAQRHGRATR